MTARPHVSWREEIGDDKRIAEHILAACANKPIKRILSTADIPGRPLPPAPKAIKSASPRVEVEKAQVIDYLAKHPDALAVEIAAAIKNNVASGQITALRALMAEGSVVMRRTCEKLNGFVRRRARYSVA
jgi:hypothetical protein